MILLLYLHYRFQMSGKVSDIDAIIETLKQFKQISEQEVKFITDKAM